MLLSDVVLVSVALAFIILVIFLIILIVRLLKTLKKIEPILNEVNYLSIDVNEKMNCVQPLFRAFSNLGECAETKSRFFKEGVDERTERQRARRYKVAESMEFRGESDQRDGVLPEVLECALLGLNIWKKMKNQK